MKVQAVILASALALLACGGDSTEPTSTSGTLAFTYTGAGTNGSATFSASGTAPVNPATNFGTTAWAVGTTADPNEFDVIGAIPRSSTSWDLADITTPTSAVGTYTINSTCSGNNCSGFVFGVGFTQNESAYTFLCVLTSGSITISTLTSSRASGTFAGTGSCITQAGAVSNFATTNGTFDVHLQAIAFGSKGRRGALSVGR